MPTKADIQAALLTAAQVGPGFAQQPPASGISEGSMTSVCPAAGVGGSPSAMVVSSFVASPQSPQAVTEDSCSTPSPRPGPQLSQFAAVVPTPLGEVRVQASLSEVAFLGVGDQDAAIRVTATLTFGHGQFPASGDIVAVRRGGTVILVINAAAVQADTGLTQSIVRKGARRGTRPPVTAQAGTDGVKVRSGLPENRVDGLRWQPCPRAGRRRRLPASPAGLRSHAWTLASISSSEAAGLSRRMRCRYIRTPASHRSKTSRNFATSAAATHPFQAASRQAAC